MGEVYLVRHPRLPRLEALKILPEDVSADPEFRQRFAREADIAASLWHSHIVAVHDRGEHEGQLWIAMDYVEGTDAAQRVRDRYPHGMPPKDALEIVSAVGDALDYAHERYLLHRDVKPANILLTDPRSGDRRIMLADFGIAKAANETHGITRTNMTVGSVAYAAPEQLTGNKLDGRADQYALACTAFHLLTGQQPFPNSNPVAVIGSHLSSPPPRLGTLRADLGSIEGVLAKAMSKEPHQRFDTCREFAAALNHGDAGWASSGRLAIPSGGTDRYRCCRVVGGGNCGVHRCTPGAVAAVAGSHGGTTSAEYILGGTRATEAEAPETVKPPAETVTVTQPVPQPKPVPSPPPPRPPQPPPGDLGLRTPMSRPACSGQWIVVLGNVTTPGQYAEGVQQLLTMYPGSSYLRTDQSCPSLRQADDEGDPIYAVYRPAGTTQSQACAAVRIAGGDAYVKVLDYTTRPDFIPC